MTNTHVQNATMFSDTCAGEVDYKVKIVKLLSFMSLKKLI